MSYQTIPLQAVANQSFTVQLNGQNCAINLYQLGAWMYFDLTVNGNQCVQSMLCHNLVKLVRESYQGFKGNLFFFDTQSNTAPVYSGLGSQYVLLYSPT